MHTLSVSLALGVSLVVPWEHYKDPADALLPLYKRKL